MRWEEEVEKRRRAGVLGRKEGEEEVNEEERWEERRSEKRTGGREGDKEKKGRKRRTLSWIHPELHFILLCDIKNYISYVNM